MRKCVTIAAMAAMLVSGAGCRSARELGQDRDRAPGIFRVTEEVARNQRCNALAEAERKTIEAATDAGQRAVIAAVRRTNPDPAGDAADAAARGEWGLIRSYTMMGSFPYGAQCRESDANLQAKPLTRAYRVFSDVIGSCETFGADGDCALDARLDRYAETYNRAIVEHPAYPYRDICRVTGPGGVGAAEPDRRAITITDLGFRPPAPGPARTMAEAARRGDLTALASFARADRAAIDLADPYRLTPLGWAVLYRQPEAVRRLLAEGAAADGGDCGGLVAESPYRLALLTGQDALADQLLAATPAKRRPARWSRVLLEAAAMGGAVRSLERMLREDNDGTEALFNRYNQLPAATRALLDRHGVALCWQGKLPPRVAVELIALYEGKRPASRTGGDGNPGQVSITVTASAKPKLLVVSAYRDTIWTVQLQPGAKLAGVIAIGNKPQQIRGVPSGVSVLRNWRNDRCGDIRQTYGYEGSRLDRLKEGVEAMIGRKVDRGQTAYAGDHFGI